MSDPACARCGDPVREGRTLCFTCAQTVGSATSPRARSEPPLPRPADSTTAPTPQAVDPVAACPRCGTFGLLTPTLGRVLCANCVERLIDVAAREPPDVASLVRGTLRTLLRILGPALAITVVPWLLLAGPIALAGHATVAVYVYELTLRGLSTGVIAALGLQVLGGADERSFGAAMRDVGRAAPRLVAVQAMTFVVVTVATTCLVLPGLYLSAALSLAPAIVLCEASRAPDAMTESFSRARAIVVPLVISIVVVGLPGALCSLVAALLVRRTGHPPHVAHEGLSFALRVAGQALGAAPHVLGVVAYAKVRTGLPGRAAEQKHIPLPQQ